MLKKLVGLAVVLAIAGLAVFWFVTAPVTVAASALPAYAADAARGKDVFYQGGCASCHATLNQDNKLLLGGGLAIPSPFGTFHAPNISPNPVDGIGRWSEANFVTAMQKGVAPDGAHYFPAFPYPSYQRMSVADIRDLFAFIKTLPQAAGKAPDHELPFPFNVRRNVGVWKFLFLDGKPFEPDPKQSAQWNRGAYLVNGAGHCAECHTPRNFLGGMKSSQRFAGGPNPEGEGFVPNITQARLSAWSEKDFEEFLKTGTLPDFDSTGGAMARVIRNTSQLSDADRAAMAVYLKSLAPVEGPKAPPRKG